MNLHGTQTEKNLLKAFAGESIARTKYQLFADQAKKDGYISIQHIFLETADHELSHAKTFFKFLEGYPLEIQATFPSSQVGDTKNNLLHAFEGELYEHSSMYPEFKKTAETEGFNKIASMFKVIGEVEIQHEKRFKRLYDLLDTDTFFKREKPVEWKCLKCGYVHFSKKAFEHCPACNHPRAYFETIESFY